MNSPIGFRTDKTSESQSSVMQIRPAAAIADTAGNILITATKLPRVADYAYRIAALAAALVLIGTVM